MLIGLAKHSDLDGSNFRRAVSVKPKFSEFERKTKKRELF